MYGYCPTLPEPDPNYINNIKIWKNYIYTKYI
jgi:hypothetical protein